MDVITKEGILFLQGVKFGKKIWRKTWLIVFESSTLTVGRMELYDMRDRWGLLGFGTPRPAGLKKTDKQVICLSDCLSITPAPGESGPTGCSCFFLNTTACTYTMAAPICEGWMSLLCQVAFQKSSGIQDARKSQRDDCTHLDDNDIYSSWGVGQFQVTVQNTDGSQRCRISGSYLLSVEKEAVALLDLKTGHAIYHWPYRHLRRFGQVKGGISLESGRRCHTGEGHFIFLSNQSSQIHSAIEDAVMHQRVQDLLVEASSQPQVFAAQPPSSQTQVKKPPPVETSQDRPRLVVRRKHGQQIHTAIEEVLMHQSAPDLLTPSTPLQRSPLPPPPSSKPKTQETPKDMPLFSLDQKRTEMKKPTQPTNRAVQKDLIHNNVQELPPSTPSPTVPTPAPRMKVPRRNISEPDLLSTRSPPSSPDDVLYANLLLEPKSRTRMNLPTPPNLVHIKQDTDVNMDQEKNSAQEAESKDEDNPYINWTAKTTVQHNAEGVDIVYSKLNFTAKSDQNDQSEDRSEEQPNIDQPSQIHGFISTEIPADFKQTLSNILFKDLSKVSPSFLSRSHGGSSDHLERTDGQMTD